MKLIYNWNVAWRWFSVQLQGAILALSAGWTVMPQEWKDAVPKWVLIALAASFAFATIAGRLVRQEPPNPAKDGQN